jgi:DNA modification methylase
MELNKIYNMDCLQGIDQIEDRSIDLIITDPPYEFISKNPRGGGFMKEENKKHLVEIDKSFGMSFEPTLFLNKIKRIMKIFYLYVWTNRNLLIHYIDFANENKYVWDLLIWSKTNPVPTFRGHYLIDKEYCVMIRKKRSYFNSTLGYENYFTFFQYPVGRKRLHPAEKPIDFIKRMISISSKEGDVVFDPYIGGGTTAVAAKELNRKYIGFEILEKYFKIANKRIANIDKKNIF